jgi:hypothetical protein
MEATYLLSCPGCGVFNDAASSSDYVASSLMQMNFEELEMVGRKRSWATFRYYTGISGECSGLASSAPPYH